MNLKTYRAENNIKMTEIAAAVGKSVQHLYEIERGDAFPSRKLAKELSAFTGGVVPVGELLYPAPVPGLSDTPPHKKKNVERKPVPRGR